MSRVFSRFSALAFMVMCLGLTSAASNADAGTPMFRFYRATSGEHFFTGTFSEGVNAGLKSEGIGFQFYSSSGIGRIAIYRCYASGWHFISTASNCGGSTVEGQYGWIDSGQISGTVALQGYYQSATGDRIYTTDSAEGTAVLDRGYSSLGTLGYVPAYTVTTASGQACDGSTNDTSVLQTAITNAAGGHLIIPAGSGACMVDGLSIPSNTQVTVNATLKLRPNQSTALNGDGTRNILNAYWASTVVIDGTGVLDGNRANQTASGIFMAGIGTLYADTVMILRPTDTSTIAVGGLTIKNTQNSPINVVATSGAVMQDVTAFDSGNPVEFAGDTSNCSADGLRIYNINPPGVTSEAGFAFYGGAHSCALRNSVVSNSTFGVLVLNDSAQAGQNHDILVDNVEVYAMDSVGAGLIVATNSGLTSYNYNITFQNSRAHGSANNYLNINGTNVTFTSIDTTGSTSSKSQILGYIDGFGATGSGKYDLYGWSCTTYNPDPVYVALYIGSTAAGWGRANQLSETAVGSACASGGRAHRYVIHFSASQITTWQGQTVSVFGISPWGFANNSLIGTGTTTVPNPY